MLPIIDGEKHDPKRIKLEEPFFDIHNILVYLNDFLDVPTIMHIDRDDMNFTPRSQ